VLVTAVFAGGGLDFAAAKVFYRADPHDHWPLGRQLPWAVLFRMGSWFAGALVLAGLAALATGFALGRDALRRNAIFVLASVVLGPGLIVNFILKDHWNRPRPRDVIEFGGPRHYAPAPLRGEGGYSFPCGHCSVGFLFALGWWIWRRRRPYLAATSAVVGLVAGIALGLGRMAAGGHFVSDVVWSALLALGIAHFLYHYILRVPGHDALPSVSRPRLQHALALLATLGAIGVLLALFVTPHGTQIATEIPLASLPQPPRVFELTARTADVEIVVVDSGPVTVSGELHGFGLPTSVLATHAEFESKPIPTLHYRIEQRGWFTDLDARLSVRLPAGELQRIAVRLDHGDVKVTDATGDRALGNRIRLDLGIGGRLVGG
jgi:lipid A 4'-phosphatase